MRIVVLMRIWCVGKAERIRGLGQGEGCCGEELAGSFCGFITELIRQC